MYSKTAEHSLGCGRCYNSKVMGVPLPCILPTRSYLEVIEGVPLWKV